MSVTLDTTSDGRVAVLHGLDTEAALSHLGRSLLHGAAFDDYRGLVIDLGGHQPSPPTADLLAHAGRERLRHHQVVTTVTTRREVPGAIDRTRRWIDRYDQPGNGGVAAVVARDASSLRSVVEAGVSIVSSLPIRLLRSRLTP